MLFVLEIKELGKERKRVKPLQRINTRADCTIAFWLHFKYSERLSP